MCIKTTVPVLTDRGLVPPVEATHGYWTMKVMQPAPATATARTPALAGKRKAKQSMPAAIITATEAGRNIPAVSIGAKVIAGIVVHPAMITLRTA